MHHEETSSPDGGFSALGLLSSTAGRLGVLMLDRVTERSRAAQLARHYRDQEGLSIAEIARRLGRAEATIKAYLYDPTGDKARAVKARYRGACCGCGAPTAPRNGKGDAYAYCKRCHPGAIALQWTRERVREAMRAWRARYGAAPSSYDWSRTHARRRGGEALKRLQAGEWPAPSTVIDLYTSWAAAIADAFGALSVRASMPLTYERGLALTACERERLRSPRRFCHCVRRGAATPRARGRLSAAVRRTEAQIPGRRRSRPRRERDHRNQWGSDREHRAPPERGPSPKSS